MIRTSQPGAGRLRGPLRVRRNGPAKPSGQGVPGAEVPVSFAGAPASSSLRASQPPTPSATSSTRAAAPRVRRRLRTAADLLRAEPGRGVPGERGPWRCRGGRRRVRRGPGRACSCGCRGWRRRTSRGPAGPRLGGGAPRGRGRTAARRTPGVPARCPVRPRRAAGCRPGAGAARAAGPQARRRAAGRRGPWPGTGPGAARVRRGCRGAVRLSP